MINFLIIPLIILPSLIAGFTGIIKKNAKTALYLFLVLLGLDISLANFFLLKQIDHPLAPPLFMMIPILGFVTLLLNLIIYIPIHLYILKKYHRPENH